MTNDTSKATGRPWRRGREVTMGRYVGVTIADKAGATACVVLAGNGLCEQRITLIVERVNGWEALVAERDRLREALKSAIERAGFPVSGPTHPDVAEDEGEPRWVAYAREALASSPYQADRAALEGGAA